MRFSYQAEKFSTARSTLMPPHPQGEEKSIALAFHECFLGLDELDEDGLDDHAKELVDKLKEFMDTSGLSDPEKQGLFAVKAATLGVNQRSELSRIVDQLASYFGGDAFGRG